MSMIAKLLFNSMKGMTNLVWSIVLRQLTAAFYFFNETSSVFQVGFATWGNEQAKVYYHDLPNNLQILKIVPIFPKMYYGRYNRCNAVLRRLTTASMFYKEILSVFKLRWVCFEKMNRQRCPTTHSTKTCNNDIAATTNISLHRLGFPISPGGYCENDRTRPRHNRSPSCFSGIEIIIQWDLHSEKMVILIQRTAMVNCDTYFCWPRWDIDFFLFWSSLQNLWRVRMRASRWVGVSEAVRLFAVCYNKKRFIIINNYEEKNTLKKPFNTTKNLCRTPSEKNKCLVGDGGVGDTEIVWSGLWVYG